MENKKVPTSDPYILLSWINMKLRDEFDSFSTLCEDYQLIEEEILNMLKLIGYKYNEKINQFFLE